MTVLERKKYLKSKIDNIFDEKILELVEQLLNTEESIFEFTPQQLAEVREAQAQYERGEFMSNEEDEKYWDEWFREQEK